MPQESEDSFVVPPVPDIHSRRCLKCNGFADDRQQGFLCQKCSPLTVAFNANLEQKRQEKAQRRRTKVA